MSYQRRRKQRQWWATVRQRDGFVVLWATRAQAREGKDRDEVVRKVLTLVLRW